MSTAAPARPRSANNRAKVAIVASLYNEQLVQGLIDSTKGELQELLPYSEIVTYRVPGAFEIPVCAEFVLQHAKPDVLIALGVILRGATEHGDLIAASVTDSLQQMAIKHVIPVIHEVLLVNSEEQARERCLGDRLNRGTEAGRVAVNMIQLFEKLHANYPSASQPTDF